MTETGASNKPRFAMLSPATIDLPPSEGGTTKPGDRRRDRSGGDVRQIFLYPITGLYNECHDVDFVAMQDATPPGPGDPHTLRSLNDLWWQRLLNRESVAATVARLQGHVLPGLDTPLVFEAIRAAPERFVDEVVDAPWRLVDLGAGPRSAFRALETLQVFVDLHSQLVSRPFELSLQEGYVVNELSSLELIQASLNPALNPYLGFLEETAFPVFEQEVPDLVWLVGRIKLSTFAMAMHIKKLNPECHISVVGHSSEYYSLNKITKYLKTNGHLFSVIDSIVLDDFDNTPRLLREALEAGHDLESVPNLMYTDGTHIRQTGYVTAGRELDADLRVPTKRPEYEAMIAPSSIVAETRLWPAAQCYWNNCNFCAINRRYNTLPKNSFASEGARAEVMQELADRGVQYLWSVDEAIPPVNLGILADELIERGAPLIWETRSKIDKNFSSDICAKLGKSGLREIRLGLESGNPRVLSSMGKYGEGWDLSTVESIVERFHQAGVSVHFPTIIGYPGETDDERQDTYRFLEYLVGAYPSVTFNINVLGFDVASRLFEEYESFGVTTLRWPTPTKYFLGNLIDWDCAETPFNYIALDHERNAFMRRVLYPWMPETARIEPYIFYRLTETSRATMVWKGQRAERGEWREPSLTANLAGPIATDPSLVVMGPFSRGRFDDQVHYSCYSWQTHQGFECDEFAFTVLESLRSPSDSHALAERLSATPDELEPVIAALVSVGAIKQATPDSGDYGATVSTAPVRWHQVPEAAPVSRRQVAPVAVTIGTGGGVEG